VSQPVELITYADRLAPDLRGLTEVLDGPLAGLFGGVHVLPFFVPIDGSDAGFDPDDHRRVDPRMGTWTDVERLGELAALTADLIVNHISARSAPFRDYLEHGSESVHAGMFLTLDTVFPDGATEQDLLAIYRPRPGLPFTAQEFADGGRRLLWTTFTADQIDLDLACPAAIAYLDAILDTFAEHGVSTVRLDAVGYAVKRAGTSCFLIPETLDFVDRLCRSIHERGMEALVEVHAHHRHQLEIAARVDWVYDFALPPLLLHGLFTGEVGPLAEWLTVRPPNCVTVLDTHDGIGVVDVAPEEGPHGAPGLLDGARIDALVEQIHRRSGGASRRATGVSASNLDLYQVNCTFHDALGGDDTSHLLARLVQLLLPGRPQLYYVGLLAGGNDTELLAASGVGRDINRHRYTPEEIDGARRRPVVRALFNAIRLRARHAAFDGVFTWRVDGPSQLVLGWEHDDATVELNADLGEPAMTLSVADAAGTRTYTSVDELASAGAAGP
jgi:sucrose phosphorylase